MRAEKTQLVHDIRALIDASPDLFLMGYTGLTAADFRALRGALAACGSECHVVPNRLLAIAAKEAGLSALSGTELKLDTAMVGGGEDPVAVAKVLRDFARTHDKAVVRMAVLEGKLLSARVELGHVRARREALELPELRGAADCAVASQIRAFLPDTAAGD